MTSIATTTYAATVLPDSSFDSSQVKAAGATAPPMMPAKV